MHIIALMNQKGGVGKTTTTVNLGAALADLGQRVCLVDMDPQAHLTINFGLEPSPEQVTLYDVLVRERSIADAVTQVRERLSIVPSSIDLAAAEIELVSILGRETLLRKRLELTPIDADYLLLDCPPSLGLLTVNALAVAQEVLIPMQAHFLALQGVGKLLETVSLVKRRINPPLKVLGVVLTMHDAQAKLSGEVIADLEGFLREHREADVPWRDARVFKTRIRRNIKLAEAPGFGEPINRYDASSHGARDYRALAEELLAAHGKPVSVDPPRVEVTVTKAKPRRGEQVA